ncbi:50S ribosomal protein L29 [Patescibacteria group bacterium]|nr:50S ribosomal protein L29 [Patescibacteria group bacterium]
MSKKESKNLKELSSFELQKELSNEKQKLVDLKFDLSAGKVKNIKEVKKTKKRVAQLLTALNAQEK